MWSGKAKLKTAPELLLTPKPRAADISTCTLALGFVAVLPLGNAPSHSTPTPRPRRQPSSIPLRRGQPMVPLTAPVTPRRACYRHTQDARRKISAANKGNIPWNKGRKHSEETRRKIAAATKMAMTAPHVREKLRLQATGRRHTEETKRKIRTSSRLRRSSGADSGKSSSLRRSRTPVPFEFSHELVAALDSCITKRYRRRFIEEPEKYRPDGRPRRPMPEATRRKLSERIRQMWADDAEYRNKVSRGIEARYKRSDGKSPLTDAHKDAIRQSLLKRHAALREARGESPNRSSPTPSSSPLRRRPRHEPTDGTRLSDRFLSPEARLAREERRLRTAQALFDAEEQEEDEQTRESELLATERERLAAREEASVKRESDERRRTNRMLLESLAMAGQLPSLDEEGAMLGSSLETAGNISDADARFTLDTSDGGNVPYFGSGLNLEPPSPIEDPFLVSQDPQSQMMIPSSAEPSFSDMFVNMPEHLEGQNMNLSFESATSAGVSTRSVSAPQVPGPRAREDVAEDDESTIVDIRFGDFSPIDKSLCGLDEDETSVRKEDVKGEDTSAQESMDLYSSGESGDVDYISSHTFLDDRSSSDSGKRIVHYVNGERVFNSTF